MENIKKLLSNHLLFVHLLIISVCITVGLEIISKDYQWHRKLEDQIDNLRAQELDLQKKMLMTDRELILLKEQNQSLVRSVPLPEISLKPTVPVLSGSTTLSYDNSLPGSGYRRQRVKTDIGVFTVDIVSADLNSTRVIVDTASGSDCFDNCPVMPLTEYVSRNNAFAGVNGSYFCPSTYPQCVNKKNSFDTLLMNKNKVYFNSDNNVYSTVPSVIFSSNSARFVQRSLEWGRDTSVDGVIANDPLLVFNNAIAFGGDSDPKHNNKGARSFVGVTGSMVYIGVVRNATVIESAKVLHALGIHNALNLDDGGSTALWFGGYKVGPGRNIPNAVLLVKR